MSAEPYIFIKEATQIEQSKSLLVLSLLVHWIIAKHLLIAKLFEQHIDSLRTFSMIRRDETEFKLVRSLIITLVPTLTPPLLLSLIHALCHFFLQNAANCEGES